jgi:hypothetical protein
MRTLVLLVIVATLAACAFGRGEDFGPAFGQMQSDPEFLVSRAHRELQIVEVIARSDGSIGMSRVIPCSIGAMQAAGWQVLPGATRLAKTGTAFSPPEHTGRDKVRVALGQAEGNANAVYFFQSVQGQWQLARVELYTVLEQGEPLPPLPCNPGT